MGKSLQLIAASQTCGILLATRFFKTVPKKCGYLLQARGKDLLQERVISTRLSNRMLNICKLWMQNKEV